MKYLNAVLWAGCVAVGFSAVAATPVDWSKLPPAAATPGVTFDKDIAPVFKASCVRCHGAERPRAQLRLDTLEGVLKGTKQGPVLAAGDSANSLLVKSVSQLDPQTAMPPKPRARRGPQGAGSPMQPRDGNAVPGGPVTEPPHFRGPEGGDDHGPGERPPGGPQGTNGPGQRPRKFGPPAKPLTPEQVGLVRAWIDQGAK